MLVEAHSSSGSTLGHVWGEFLHTMVAAPVKWQRSLDGVADDSLTGSSVEYGGYDRIASMSSKGGLAFSVCSPRAAEGLSVPSRRDWQVGVTWFLKSLADVDTRI